MTYVGTVTQSHCSYVVPPNRILLNKQRYLRNWQFPLPCFTQSIFLAFHSLVFFLFWNPLFCLLKLTVVQTSDPNKPVIVWGDLHCCIHQKKWGLTNLRTAAEVIIQHPLLTTESSIAWNGTISVSRDANGAEMPAWQDYEILLATKEEKFMGFQLQLNARSGKVSTEFQPQTAQVNVSSWDQSWMELYHQNINFSKEL